VNVWLMPVFWFLVKVLALHYCTIWVRASLPRMRYDRLMALGWKYLIEIAILWVLVSAVLVVAREEDWNVWLVTPIAAAGALAAFGVLYLCMPRASERVEEFR
jgi:NADH-quinone oxidoreductase subunit H